MCLRTPVYARRAEPEPPVTMMLSHFSGGNPACYTLDSAIECIKFRIYIIEIPLSGQSGGSRLFTSLYIPLSVQSFTSNRFTSDSTSQHIQSIKPMLDQHETSVDSTYLILLTPTSPFGFVFHKHRLGNPVSIFSRLDLHYRHSYTRTTRNMVTRRLYSPASMRRSSIRGSMLGQRRK